MKHVERIGLIVCISVPEHWACPPCDGAGGGGGGGGAAGAGAAGAGSGGGAAADLMVRNRARNNRTDYLF